MPYSPARPCTQGTRCPHLVSTTTPCPTHGARTPWQRTSTYTQPVGSGYAWQRLRQQIIQRDGGRCRLQLPGCTAIATTADHIVGKAAGGSDASSNLIASCRACNETKRKVQAREGRNR